ncbi:polyketide cyclase [Bergeyella sp. RCAD1439]|uniref:polyketide cyclase n=1 Tax=Bergeyella anatis TaxID=3113737 RepID=UPI002E16CE33|nr:polyketide cyclase [Bergeyella sp. RCAD1439]
MRWIKFFIVSGGLLLAVYAASMYFVDESKTFTIEKEIAYPLDKVYPQFNDFRQFTRWNQYFISDKGTSLVYYTPYIGQGASMGFSRKGSGEKGEMYIRYENPYKTLRYQLFEGDDSMPYRIDVKFKAVSPQKTKMTWLVHTPKQPWLKRTANLWSESDFVGLLDKSMANLSALLGNKVNKDEMLASIKYDSLMVEKSPGELLLGINVSTSNKGDALIKNIVMNHNKVCNFVTVDLAKQEDEFGLPVLLTDANNTKDKEVSYYYGVPLSKRSSVSDNNFSFRTLHAGTRYVLYYKGAYKNRGQAIQQLLQKAKKDTMRYGELQQVFIEPPKENGEVNLKLALPVFR